MRIFIGIQLEEDIKTRIEKELKPFKKMGTPIRWAKPGNVHLTLKFIGEVADELYPQIESALAETSFGFTPFRVQGRGLGKFPAGDEVHIFWVGIEPSAELESLFHKIEDILARFRIERETRPFVPHITVGRNKARFPFKRLMGELENKSDVRLGDWTVGSFQIFESRLTPQGPVYTVRKEVVLG